jgi:hypothetical protein
MSLSLTEQPALRLALAPVNTQVFAVHCTGSQAHIGNLKRIGAVWKLKAIGHTPCGELEPGGGPLTAAHNQVFEHINLHEINARLAPWLPA